MKRVRFKVNDVVFQATLGFGARPVQLGIDARSRSFTMA
jgi:hypothetical protein